MNKGAFYAGDAEFVYYRIDRFIKDVLVFLDYREHNIWGVRMDLERWFEEWDGQAVDSFAWLDEILERHATRKRDRSRHIPTKVRRQVMERDGCKCVACGAAEKLVIDHIKPFSRHGSHTPRNLQVLCATCNSGKRAQTMEEWQSGRG